MVDQFILIYPLKFAAKQRQILHVGEMFKTHWLSCHWNDQCSPRWRFQPLKQMSQLGWLETQYVEKNRFQTTNESCFDTHRFHMLPLESWDVPSWVAGLLSYRFHGHLPALLCEASEELSDELWFLPAWLVHGRITPKNHGWLGISPSNMGIPRSRLVPYKLQIRNYLANM